ncbi:universal stress protein [Halobacteriaceae archaeon GCM10025711]
MDTPLEVETVLVPVDGSDESFHAAEYAIAIAERYGAAVHVLYVLGEPVARALDAGDITDDDITAEQQSFVADITDGARDHDVEVTSATACGFSTTRKTLHPGSVVLDCAEDQDADFIVIPRESTNEGPGDVLEKAAEYVLLYASQPVFSV